MPKIDLRITPLGRCIAFTASSNSRLYAPENCAGFRRIGGHQGDREERAKVGYTSTSELLQITALGMGVANGFGIRFSLRDGLGAANGRGMIVCFRSSPRRAPRARPPAPGKTAPTAASSPLPPRSAARAPR